MEAQVRLLLLSDVRAADTEHWGLALLRFLRALISQIIFEHCITAALKD